MAFYRKSTETRISEALLALLQAGAFEVPVTFSRGPLPVLKKELLSSAVAVVVPSSQLSGPIDRARDEKRITIGVAVAKSIGLSATTGRDREVEDLSALVEQIADYVADRDRAILTLPAVSDGVGVIMPAHNARLVPPVVLDPLFSVQLLREESIFFAVPLFTYHFETLRD